MTRKAPAQVALDTLNRKDLGQCKTMSSPPKGVDKVFSCLLVLFANLYFEDGVDIGAIAPLLEASTELGLAAAQRRHPGHAAVTQRCQQEGAVEAGPSRLQRPGRGHLRRDPALGESRSPALITYHRTDGTPHRGHVS